jgi:cytochrome c oxidase assembly protein Cox11
VRTKLKYPLPGISTLQRYQAININLREGILRNVFSIMEAMGNKSFEKVAVLSFDEMKVNSVYEYDTSLEI